jgi:hypothetical protein
MPKGQIAWNKGLEGLSGSKSPNWKGGKPRCISCGKLLAKYGAKHCKKHVIITKKTRKLMSKIHKGNTNTLGKKWTEEQKAKLKGRTPWNKGKPYPRVTGSRQWNWQGGISQKNRTERANIMSTLGYVSWRKDVFARDNYTCVLCGAKNVTLNADHIKSFAKYPELRLEVSNGRTLCVPCHKKVTFSK